MLRLVTAVSTAVAFGAFGTVSRAQLPAADVAHQHAQPALNGVTAPDLVGTRVDFALADRDGRIVRDDDFRGRHLLVGFGFTHCTDVCPTMAFNMARALDTSNSAAGVFVSVDTERDTAAATDDYARAFHERLTGLGGNVDQVNAAARDFHVSYAVTKTQSSYTVQHTSHVYLIDPDGVLIQVFSFATPSAEIAAAMR